MTQVSVIARDEAVREATEVLEAEAINSARVIVYDGVLRGLERGAGPDGCWAFEGVGYDSPATESEVEGMVEDALAEPSGELRRQAHELLFGRGGSQYTAQAVLALAEAYERECEGGDGVSEVVRILAEAARRIAVIEALTV